MPTLLHHKLPAGADIELLNVSAHVARRDNDDPASDYILVFEEHKEQVKVYVPMSEESYRQWVTAQYEALQTVKLPSPLEIVRHGKRNGSAV